MVLFCRLSDKGSSLDGKHSLSLSSRSLFRRWLACRKTNEHVIKVVALSSVAKTYQMYPVLNISNSNGQGFLVCITKTRLFKYIQNISPPKTDNFSGKNFDIFHISAQNIDCGYSLEPPYQGGSNEYPQFMFLSRNKKINVYPCKPQLYYIKVGFKGVKIIQACFRDGDNICLSWKDLKL